MLAHQVKAPAAKPRGLRSIHRGMWWNGITGSWTLECIPIPSLYIAPHTQTPHMYMPHILHTQYIYITHILIQFSHIYTDTSIYTHVHKHQNHTHTLYIHIDTNTHIQLQISILETCFKIVSMTLFTSFIPSFPTLFFLPFLVLLHDPMT